MDKQQKLKTALPILAVIMIFVWGPVIIGSGSKDKNKSKNSNNRSSGNISGNASGNIDNIDLMSLSSFSAKKRAQTAYAQWGRNPFMLGYDAKALVIEGIVWDELNPEAVINGNIVGVGDRIGSNIIMIIRPNSVVIRNRGEDIELQLGEGRQF